MSQNYFALAFTDHVMASQVQYGSRSALERVDRQAGQGVAPTDPSPPGAESPDDWDGNENTVRDPMGSTEREFVALQDGFYLATVSENGWPYVQFRGGGPGFVSSPDEHTLAWADFRGNRQYISTGNLDNDPRVALIFLDYARQTRLKVFGVARVADVRGQGAQESPLAVPGYRARIEREIHIDVRAYDWNCPQHITPRFSIEEIAVTTEALRQRVDDLEAQNEALRRQLATSSTKP